MSERLQKLISAAGIASRRAAEALIAQGRVTVNGAPAAPGQRADPSVDDIRVDGAALSTGGEKVYIMLNKPRGCVTTLSDERGRPTVAALVEDAGIRLYPVGRLDYNSEGLLLMTNDGGLANALTHPSHGIGKTYLVEVAGDIEKALPVLRGPMEVDGRPIRAAGVKRAGGHTLYLTIREGRNRQIRRMCAAAGLEVRRLTRVAEGPLRLGDLPPGKWRYLTENEISEIKTCILPGGRL